ncbi:ATP-binding protein [Actinosynnema sp. NPDC023658]|uniref:NACHT domain-containing protein n=1 Tax=Actinosynnema sp. NPDC023658 TaxID=3155465 RepID=UPI0033FCCB9C
MTKRFSYADAVRLLGAREQKLVAALDRLVGGALLAGATFGISELLGWFDAKVDFVRLAHELLVKAGARRRGLTRYDRTERLQAAHAVIVVVAFFDAVAALRLPPALKTLDVDKSEQSELLGLTSLFDGVWPLPSAACTYSENLGRIGEGYARSAAALLTLLRNRAAWRTIDVDERGHVSEVLTRVESTAIRRYEELVRELAGDYPELSLWLQLRHGAAVEASLGRIETALTAVLVGREPDTRREELSRQHRAVLTRPILDTEDVPTGLNLPVTEQAYIDPDFQIVTMQQGAAPSQLQWWEKIPSRSDLHQCLAGHLTSPHALAQPLVVLGDPGAGKSLLTKVLAARLPAADFLALRVELRSVPAESDLLEQVEHGIRASLHDPVSLAELSRIAGDAVPVVILDGFDELLQVTGVTNTDYLTRVEKLQRECAAAGRPIIVIVTSRIGVASTMRIPVGASVLRLGAFTDGHVARWLQVWNATNAGFFGSSQRTALTPDTVLAHRDLAVQPLLLLMLALYDATDDALRRNGGDLPRAELYDRLLSSFALREVSKDNRDRTEADLATDVENELTRLAVVAFAMFHRGALWASETDLDHDLAALLDWRNDTRRHGMRTPITPGGTMLARFFFIQRAEAVNDLVTLRTYEFLHATFGEYLVARLTWHVLCDLHRVESTQRPTLSAGPADDSNLYALLSFTPLTARKSVIDFLIELAATSTERPALAALVARLFETADEHRPRSRGDYRPSARGVPARFAIHSLNLVLLATILSEELDTSDFGIADWPKLTAFWKSQLSDGEWESLIGSIHVQWQSADRRVITAGSWSPRFVDRANLPPAFSLWDAARETHFTTDPAGNLFRYAFEGLSGDHFDLSYARAVVELNTPAPQEKRSRQYQVWADTHPQLVLDRLRREVIADIDVLRTLAGTRLGLTNGFLHVLCERLGTTTDDEQLLALIGEVQTRIGHLPALDHQLEVPLLDAWLRLHEAGFKFPEERNYPDLVELMSRINLIRVQTFRPDLIRRVDAAMQDLGI